jgi:riboflavin kinase/FMN adenylyltransferase
MNFSNPPKKLSAKVIKGAGRGRKLGIPTINFDPSALLRTSPSAGKLKEGVYVCRVVFPSSPYWGVLHFGSRPTFGEESRSLEVYLFDFDDVQIPKQLDIEVYSYIRKIVKFANPSQMVKKIEKDIVFAKKRIKLLQKN